MLTASKKSPTLMGSDATAAAPVLLLNHDSEIHQEVAYIRITPVRHSLGFVDRNNRRELR